MKVVEAIGEKMFVYLVFKPAGICDPPVAFKIRNAKTFYVRPRGYDQEI
jgi:hypothetical protein